MREKKIVIFNGDDQYLKTIRVKKISQEKISYAFEAKADYQASDIQQKTLNQIIFKVSGRSFTLATAARHNVYNALAAIACARLLNLTWENIKKSLAEFQFSGGRQEVRRVGGLWLIDDTYNSNPISLQSAIQSLAAFQWRGKKILICGDMLELGKWSKPLHQKMGKIINELNLDCVLTIGNFSKYIVQSINGRNPNLYKHHCENIQDLEDHLRKFCRKDDVLLIKGSRGMRMEQIVESIEQKLNV